MADPITTPRPQKRKVTKQIDTPSPLPISKRARYEASSKTDEVKVWESIRRDMEASSTADNHSTPSSPAESFSFTDAVSVAATSATSRSTSKRPKKYLCEVPGCGKAFDRPVRVQIHMRSHANERPYVCEEDDGGCGKTFLRAEHLKRHVKDKHSEDRNHICTYAIDTAEDGTSIACGKSFTTATRLRRHAAAHEAKEETTCSHPGCGKVFRKQETLQRHVKTEHLGEKPFKCSNIEMGGDGQPVECQQAFSKVERLKSHEAREHSRRRYFCEICTPAAPNGVDMDEDIEMAALMAVPECVGFPTYTDLQLHIRTAHPPTCADCCKQCESNRALKAHIDIEHSALSDRQTHICTWPACGRGFTKAGNLKVHVQSVHMKARDFVCGSFDLAGNRNVEGWNGVGCGSAFGTKANLEEHIRTRHLGLLGKFKPSRARKAREKAEGASTTSSSLMEMDEPETPGDGSGAVSMLTGFGYEALPGRQIGCLVQGCPQRFGRDYDLAKHLELTHGWHVDDVNDRLAERDAVHGGDFWIGGGQDSADGVADEQDEVLRRSLTEAIHGIDANVLPEDGTLLGEAGQSSMHDEFIHRQIEEQELQKVRSQQYEERRKALPVEASGLYAMDDATQGVGLGVGLGVGGWEGMAIDPALHDA